MLFFDIETTGLERDCEVLEFGYITIDLKGNLVRGENIIIYSDQYDMNGKEQALKCNGFTLARLEKEKGNLLYKLSKIYALLSNECIVGKNIRSFDLNRLNNVFRKYLGQPEVPFLRFNDVQRMKIAKGSLTDYMDSLGVTSKDVIDFITSSELIDCQEDRLVQHCGLFDAVATYMCYIKGGGEFGSEYISRNFYAH